MSKILARKRKLKKGITKIECGVVHNENCNNGINVGYTTVEGRFFFFIKPNFLHFMYVSFY